MPALTERVQKKERTETTLHFFCEFCKSCDMETMEPTCRLCDADVRAEEGEPVNCLRCEAPLGFDWIKDKASSVYVLVCVSCGKGHTAREIGAPELGVF